MPELAIDSPVLDETEVTIETPEVAEEVAETPEQEAAPEVEVKGDERVMPQWIRDLKQTNPAAFKEAKGVFFSRRDLESKLKDFPLDDVKSFLEERGDLESIKSVMTELQGASEELQGINAAIASGDTSVIEKFVVASGENFPKLAEATFQKWAQADSEGWGKQMSGVFAATIDQAKLEPMLDRMMMRLQYGDTANLANELQELKNWAAGFGKAAAAPTQAPTGKTSPVDASKQELETLRKQVFDKEVGSEMHSTRNGAIEAALSSFITRKPNDTDAKGLAIRDVTRQVVERMNADTDLQGKLQALYERKDKAGFLKLLNAREAKLIEDIAPKVGRLVFGNPAAQKVVIPPTSNGVKPDAGFTPVDNPPKPHLIDKSRTTDAMIMRGQFILRDGKKLALAN